MTHHTMPQPAPAPDRAPHAGCGSIWKYDCEHDEYISSLFGEGMVMGDGDVESPVGWFGRVVLEESEAEHRVHYGSEWLIAREDGQGRFWVEVYVTESDMNARSDDLETAFLNWVGPDVLT